MTIAVIEFPPLLVVEIVSPGISRQLSSEREFQSFKGFPVIVTGQDSQGKPQEWRGKLQGRDEQSIYLNQKGRIPLRTVTLFATIFVTTRKKVCKCIYILTLLQRALQHASCTYLRSIYSNTCAD